MYNIGMKKNLSLCFFFFLSCISFAFTRNSVRTFVFENGFTMFFLEDNSCATVTMDLCVDAGFSKQTERNAGFFELYASLAGGEISSDYVRVRKTCAPLESEDGFRFVSSVLKPVSISDAALKRTLEAEKKKVSAQAADVTGFLNASIDAKMFPDAPWKTASGTSPQFFSSVTVSEARAIIEAISRKYYVPSNSFLFLSGNISAQTAQVLAQKYFGKPSEITSDVAEKNERALGEEKSVLLQEEIRAEISGGKIGSERKFVLHDAEFSSDMTQIVVQYKDFSMSEADVLSVILDQNYAPYKEELLKEKELGIRGAEYVNVASAQKCGSSRLVFQSLFEDSKLNPVQQSEIFIRKIREISFLTKNDINYAARKIRADFENTSDSSKDFMELLVQWHSLKKTDFPDQSLFDRIPELYAVDSASVQKRLHESEPFVFLLVSSKNYLKYEKRFKDGGFVPLTRKNGAWYTQTSYKELLKKNRVSKSSDIEEISDDDIQASASRFVFENKNAVSSFKLSNGIPVVVKTVANAKTVTFAMTISGGDMLFSKTPGLTSVLTDCLAVNVRDQLDIMAMNGDIIGSYNVTAKTNSVSSFLTVSCSVAEMGKVLKMLAGVLIYSDISPVLADGVTYDERTQWRIKTGSSNFQLLCEAMRQMYNASEYLSLFKENEDKPVTMDFVDIAEAYPTILDATRYSIVVAGGVQDTDSVKKALEENFGSLGTHSFTADLGQEVPKPVFSKDGVAKKIQLKHLFLTDVPADKAGPMPAVLIPTTRFLDPVLYCFESPSVDSKKTGLFNALLFEIAARMERKINDPNTKVNVFLPDTDYLFARIVTTNVLKTSTVDNAYKSAVKELKSELSKLAANTDDVAKDKIKGELLSAIESRWVLNALSETNNPEEIASQIQLGAARGNPLLYIEEYESIDNAGAGDYLKILEELIPSLPLLRIYSVDSR